MNGFFFWGGVIYLPLIDSQLLANQRCEVRGVTVTCNETLTSAEIGNEFGCMGYPQTTSDFEERMLFCCVKMFPQFISI